MLENSIQSTIYYYYMCYQNEFKGNIQNMVKFSQKIYNNSSKFYSWRYENLLRKLKGVKE